MGAVPVRDSDEVVFIFISHLASGIKSVFTTVVKRESRMEIGIPNNMIAIDGVSEN